MFPFLEKILHKKKSFLPRYDRVKLEKKKILLNNLLGGVAWGVGSVTGATTIIVILGLFITITKSIPFIGDIVTISLRQIEGAKQTASFLTSTGGQSQTVSENSLKFLIDVKKTNFSLTEFIEIEASLYNVSFLEEKTFFNTCAERLQIFIDGKPAYQSAGQCKIGPGNLESFGQITRKFYLDGSKLDLGEHTLYIVSDALSSNQLHFSLAEPTKRIDCVHFTDSISPVCAQLMVEGYTIAEPISFDDCQRTLTTFTTAPSVSPVQTEEQNCELSTHIKLVFNVPKTEEEKWGGMLRELGKDLPVMIKSGIEDVYRLDVD